ncbi:D-beta-hydroxybutyrate dehydrogenase [mine drainage metagenome]|uniref:D-beta-hydroxybutyrate dehydrogenase n=1 Tax=mine drainage metagenome TaxID=410659 RepID=A0A1J5QTY6_9ZZZZ
MALPLRCLVTGAGRGIGAAIVHRLAADGHSIALNARSGDQLSGVAATLSVPNLVLPADVTEPGSSKYLIDEIVSKWGGIDVLVLNAGAAVSASIENTDDEIWQEQLLLNLTAPFRLMREAVPVMKENGFGRIVVVASVAAKVGKPYVSAYTASKHGVLGLVRSAAAELAQTGITVNAVCPGYVDTQMTSESVEVIANKTGRPHGEILALLSEMQPVGRLIQPEEVAESVSFLIADVGGITGQGINVDGGGAQS